MYPRKADNLLASVVKDEINELRAEIRRRLLNKLLVHEVGDSGQVYEVDVFSQTIEKMIDKELEEVGLDMDTLVKGYIKDELTKRRKSIERTLKQYVVTAVDEVTTGATEYIKELVRDQLWRPIESLVKEISKTRSASTRALLRKSLDKQFTAILKDATATKKREQ